MEKKFSWAIYQKVPGLLNYKGVTIIITDENLAINRLLFWNTIIPRKNIIQISYGTTSIGMSFIAFETNNNGVTEGHLFTSAGFILGTNPAERIPEILDIFKEKVKITKIEKAPVLIGLISLEDLFPKNN